MNGTEAGYVRGEGTNLATIARMTAAELLKLYRRRALMAWAAVLFIGGQIVFYGLGALQHAADPARHAPAGGLHGLANAMMLVSYLGGVAAVMTGTAAGGGDTAAGVFRDLASTGRSRIALFAVRVPAALVVNGVLAVLSFAVTAAGAIVFAGAEPAPSAAVLAQCGLAVAVTIGVTTVLAVGLSSLLSSRSITIGLLLCWTLALARVMEHAAGLGSLREALSVTAEDRLVPVSVGGAYEVPIPGWTAALVLLAWAALALLAGAWQTARRDALPMSRFSWRSAGDLAVTGAFAVLVVAGGVFAVRSGGSPARAATATSAELIGVAALTVRRRYPLPVLAVVVVFGTVAAAVADRTIIGPLLPAVALYTLAAVSTRRVTLGAAVAAFACYGAGELAGRTQAPAAFAVLAALLLIAVTTGLYAGEHRKALAAVSERAEQAERERLLVADQAVLAERVWIARELHDAIGHHVSLLVVQAGAVRSALPDDHPTRAVLTSMIDGGREAMTEMRRLVEVLSPLDDGDRDDNVSGHGPPPGLDDLHGLCDRLRAGGLPVQLDLDVIAPPPRTAGITVYRIVQEALTNVVKHAGQVPTRVQIRADERILDLRVTNGPPSGVPAAGLGSGGHGLDGIRRRSALFGGEVFAGPVPGGGYALRATLLLQERP